MGWVVLVAGIVAIAAGGCFVGPNVEAYAPAHQPEGTLLTATTRGGEAIAGEVIDVRPGSVVILSQARLILVRWSLLRRIRITALRAFPTQGDWLDEEHFANVKLVSRFPQGMTPEIEARLLAYLGQAEIRVVER